MANNAIINEQVCVLALSRVQVHKPALLRQIMDIAGSAKELFDNLQYINDILPGVSPTLVEALKAPVFEEKIVDYIFDKSTISEKTVTIEELYNFDDNKSEAKTTKKKATKKSA